MNLPAILLSLILTTIICSGEPTPTPFKVLSYDTLHKSISQARGKEAIAKTKSILDFAIASSQDKAKEAIPKLYIKFGTRRLGDSGYVAKVNSRKTPSSQYEAKETITKAKSVLDVDVSSSQDIANEAIPKLYTKFGTRRLGDSGYVAKVNSRKTPSSQYEGQKAIIKLYTRSNTRRLGDGGKRAGVKQDTNFGTRRLGDRGYVARVNRRKSRGRGFFPCLFRRR